MIALFPCLFWIQFISLTVALIWGGWLYRRNHSQWQWRLHGLALMVVPVLATPYAWFTDEVVLLPAVLQVALWACNARELFAWKTKTGASCSPASTDCCC